MTGHPHRLETFRYRWKLTISEPINARLTSVTTPEPLQNPSVGTWPPARQLLTLKVCCCNYLPGKLPGLLTALPAFAAQGIPPLRLCVQVLDHSLHTVMHNGHVSRMWQNAPPNEASGIRHRSRESALLLTPNKAHLPLP